jgi:hypothetical protein
MATTYEPIATTTLSSTAASITLSSIPSTYTDLRIVFVGKNVTGNSGLLIRFNGDTSGSTLYSRTQLIGTGSSATSGSAVSTAQWYTFQYGMPNTANTFAFATIDIFSYAGSNFKTGLITGSDDMNSSGSIDSTVGLYRSTSSITSITLSNQAALIFDTGTTATLYGIKNA